MKKYLLLALIVLCLAAFLTACSEDTPPQPDPTPEPIETYEPEPTPEPVRYRNPLTGLPVEEDISANRPIAILLDNIQMALPQHGIRQADIIYEIPVEGGITRLLAVFQDLRGVEEIGPVRSVRHYIVDIAQGHDAIFVHAGGSPQGYEAIRYRGVPNIDGVLGSGREFWRDSGRIQRAGSEHSMMTSDELILSNLEDRGFRLEHEDRFHPGLLFLPDATINGTPTQEVVVEFSTHKTGMFRYDAETDTYRVYQYSAPHMDGHAGEQLHVTNVIVLFASFSVIDNEGRLNVSFDLGGTGYYITGGQRVPILWTKGSFTSPFFYTLEDGTPLAMRPGQIYVSIVNTNTGSVTFG